MKEPRPLDVEAVLDFLMANRMKGTHTIQLPISNPSDLDATTRAAFFFWHFHESRFPNGVTVTDAGINTPNAASSYSVDFMRYDDPEDGSPDTIETVATSASFQAEDNGTIDNPDIAAGAMLAVSLPVTVIDLLHIWITFTID